MDLLKKILDSSAHLLVVLDCETARVADCNEAQCRASGRTREEFIGKAVSEIHVSFPLQTQEQWNYFVGRVEAEPGLTVETQYRKSDGSFYPVRIECFPHQVEGRRYVLVVARQMAGGPAIVQSRYEREARWQKALSQMASHPAIVAGRFDEAALFIAATGKSVFPADKCSIWRVDADRVQFLADDRGSVQASRVGPVELREFPWLETAIVTGRCTDVFEACRTPAELERTRRLTAAYDVKAALCAPIRVGGRSWGAVTIASRSEREWQVEEIGFAGEIADQIANAVASAERRRIEEALIASEERYRSFIAMSSEAVWRVEFTEPIALDMSIEEQASAVISRGYIADCNEAFAAFFYGDRREEFIGVPLARLFGPTDEARLAETRQMAKAGFRLVNLEVRHIVRGQLKWALRNTTGFFENGHLIQLWGASRDITERKQADEMLAKSEQRYRAFVGNSSEGIFRVEYPEPIPLDLPHEEIVQRTWDTGVLAECNLAYARMRGFDRPEQMTGRLSLDFRLQTQEERDQDMEFLRRGCRMVDFERPVRRSDGSLSWFSYSVTGIVESGCLARLWGRISDITERRTLEEGLRALSARRANELELERARIAREIHDELGQQLTALKFEASAWERGVRQPAKGELTQSIDEAIQTVRRIATELRPAILDHFGLVAAIEWLANDVSRRTGLECDCELQAGLQVDQKLRTTVFRIFQEALTNAVRHSGAKIVQVSLRTDAGRLELTVQDDGQGFSEEGGEEKTHSLGLIGMRERARDAGGSIKITGVPGQGTRVSAWFPLSDPGADEEAEA